jgi:hypothetical protein
MFTDEMGAAGGVRNSAYTWLKSLEHAPTINLQSAMDEIEYRKQNPLPPAMPRQRRLPQKVGMDELFNVVQSLKRDVRLIRDAQSKAGAEDWIQRNGLEEHLYVDARDIDGDDIPDIVVRDRTTRKPYIVKGYTTEQSQYPLKHKYFTKYPLAADRKGNPYRDFIDDGIVESFGDGGYNRKYTDEYEQTMKKARAAGYKVQVPKTTLTNNQAFKFFIMKPLMSAFKAIMNHVTENNYKSDALLARNLEAWFRENIVTIPVLARVYGEGILETPKEEWRKLALRKEIKEGCKAVIQQLIAHRKDEGVLMALIDTMIVLINNNGGIPKGVDLEEVKTLMVTNLEREKYWKQPKLPAAVAAAA